MRMFWHPKTGEPVTIAIGAAPPPGYLDHHPADPDPDKGAGSVLVEKAPVVPPEKAAKVPKAPAPYKLAPVGDEPMTRDELAAALKSGGIGYDVEAPDDALAATLVTALQQHLASTGVEFEPADGPRKLLTLAGAV